MSLCCMKSFSVARVRARNVNPANYNYYDSVHITGCFFSGQDKSDLCPFDPSDY